MSPCIWCPNGDEHGHPGHETGECAKHPCYGCDCERLRSSVCLRRAAENVAARFEREAGESGGDAGGSTCD